MHLHGHGWIALMIASGSKVCMRFVQHFQSMVHVGGTCQQVYCAPQQHSDSLVFPCPLGGTSNLTVCLCELNCATDLSSMISFESQSQETDSCQVYTGVWCTMPVGLDELLYACVVTLYCRAISQELAISLHRAICPCQPETQNA